MTEIELIRTNHLIDPSLHIWGWEIPVYLFLGGMAAGIMILTAWFNRNETEMRARSPWVRLLPFAPAILLSLGMFALFLDLSYKLHVFRFYLAFKWTSPMSWGSWLLILIYPATLMLGIANLSDAEMKLTGPLSSYLLKLRTLAVSHRALLVKLNIALGIGLGIYTGILLSSLARNVWNSGVLGPLFLTSGLSAGAAAMMLLPLSRDEHQAVKRIDLTAMGVELSLILLYLIGLSTVGNAQGTVASSAFLGGSYTFSFWFLVVLLGLVTPLLIETRSAWSHKLPHALAPTLVLIGGFSLRWIMVMAGQRAF